MEERIGEAHDLGIQLTVLGRKLQPGDKAPDFSLDHYDGTTMKTVCLADSAGTVRLLSVVNSLDTAVCHIETRRWESLRHQLPHSVQLLTISMDLPYAQARWQTAECVMHSTLSAHKTEQFGHDYGVLIKERRLLQRAVFVVDADGHIVHAEYVPDQMREPDYSAAIAAIHSLVGPGK